MDAQFYRTLEGMVNEVLDSDDIERKMSWDTAELEQEAFDYILDYTPPDYALWTLDKAFVTLPRQIWQNSRTLMSHSPDGKYHSVEWSFRTVENLKQLAHMRIFPSDLSHTFELIALVKYLYIPSLLRVCYDHFCHGTALQGLRSVAICTASLPRTCSRGTILRIWELVCASPMRSKSIYQHYFALLQDYCRDADFINLARRINKTKYKECLSKNIEGLPVELDCTAALIGIFMIAGAPKTAVITNGPLMATDIFGNAFKKEHQQTVRDFFFVYNRYIIYRDSNADVFYQTLSQDIEPAKMASNIIQFLDKAGHLFLIGKSWVDRRNRLYKWSGSVLVELRPLEPAGEHMDFDPDSNILCYQNLRADKLCLDFLRETFLIPCRRIEHGCIHTFVFYQKEIYVWGRHMNRVYDVDGKTNEYIRMPDAGGGVLECKVYIGQLYLRMADGWRSYRDDRLHEFSAGGQLVAFGEVSLNPYLAANLT